MTRVVRLQVTKALLYIFGWTIVSLLVACLARLFGVSAAYRLEDGTFSKALSEVADGWVFICAEMVPFVVALLLLALLALPAIRKNLEFKKRVLTWIQRMADDCMSIVYNICGFLFGAIVFFQNNKILNLKNEEFAAYGLGIFAAAMVASLLAGALMEKLEQNNSAQNAD